MHVIDTEQLDKDLERIQKMAEETNELLGKVLKDLGHDEMEVAPRDKARNEARAAGAMVTVTPDAREVLVRSTVQGNVLILPAEKLERGLYERVNKVLAAAGGKWKRGTGHIFPSAERLIELQRQWENGDKVVHVKKSTQAFYTPPDLAAKIVEMADVRGMRVLEPSAGDGSLVRTCLSHGAEVVVAVESDPVSAERVPHAPDRCRVADFLELKPLRGSEFDRVVMNPPFTKDQDIKHVTHALKFLKPGGKLVAIMSPGWVKSNRKSHQEFRALLEANQGTIEDVPAGAFKSSGTNIRTVVVTMTAN